MAEDVENTVVQDEKRGSIGPVRNPATEQAVLDAAEEILAQKGLDGLTMSEVARRARAGKATVYRWWPSPSALLMAVYQRRKLDLSYPDTGSLRGDVIAMLDLLLGLWRGPDGELFRQIIARAQSDPAMAEALTGFLDGRIARMEEMFARHPLPAGLTARAMSEQLVATAWLRLLTRRLDTTGADLAPALLGSWTAAGDLPPA